MITLYFDGACHLCSREVSHYARSRGAERLRFVNIAAPGFDAAGEGLDPTRVEKVMHCRAEDGRVLTGVDAFLEIWRVLPAYRPLRRIVSFPLVRPVAELGYHAFARLRPLLPKRQDACAIDLVSRSAQREDNAATAERT